MAAATTRTEFIVPNGVSPLSPLMTSLDAPADQLFGNLRIDASDNLKKSNTRQVCPKCNAKRMHFCYDCRVPMPGVVFPRVDLPCGLHIVKHPGEHNSKSTAVITPILAPKATLYDFPDVPTIPVAKPGQTWPYVLVFPKADAIELADLPDDWPSYGQVIVVDSTWSQTNSIISSPALRDLPCIKFSTAMTRFWRPQKNKPATFLATIEAIHEFFTQFHRRFSPDIPYDGRYDNLLFHFKFQYELIHLKDKIQKQLPDPEIDTEPSTEKLAKRVKQ